MHRLSRLALVLFVTLVVTSVSTPAPAQQQAWDQAAVTKLAQQLAKACDVWQNAMFNQPPSTIGSGAAQPDDSMNNRAKTLWSQSNGLAAHLAKGDGLDKTKDLFLSFKEVFDDNQVSIARSNVGQDALNAWKQVVSATQQLAPYYGVKLTTP